jgi:CrcB protein
VSIGAPAPPFAGRSPISGLWNLLLVFVGGGLGALARFGTGSLVQARVSWAFPFGTLVVNAIGCLAIGVVGVLILNSSAPAPTREAWRLAVVVGFLGGFTTFSAFSWETMELVDARRYAMAAIYVLGTNTLCLAFAAVGYRLGQRLLPL